jgi:hypothetical protein
MILVWLLILENTSYLLARGAIALITDQPIGQFQQFSPQDPQLIENIIKWMRSLVAEF